MSAVTTQSLPIDSLGELKNRHRFLLVESDAERTADFALAVDDFLTAGAALGKTLSLPSERAEAQRLLDFWASSTSLASDDARFPIRTVILDPYPDTGDSEAAEAAKKMVAGLSEADQAIAKRLLLRLVQLEADGMSFTPVTRNESLLINGLDPAKSHPILASFKACGLIVSREDGWSLRGSGLLSHWEEAREWLSQRRRLRGAVQFWEAHNCDENALLDGGQLLEEAAGYLDLNELERRFVEASIAVNQEKNGDIQMAQRDLPNALGSYKKSREIREKLAAHDPDNSQWQRDLSTNYEKIGDIQMAQRDLPNALGSYKKSLEVREKLAVHDPDNSQWQRDLSINYEKIGDTRKAQRDLPNALDSYKKSLEIREKLAGRDPDNSQWQHDLSVSHEKIAIVHSLLGDAYNAWKSFISSSSAATRADHSPGSQNMEPLAEMMAASQKTLQSTQEIFLSFLHSPRNTEPLAEMMAASQKTLQSTQEIFLSYYHSVMGGKGDKS
jgi:tetratricopeptide (TPR) repeat protein